MSDNVTQLPIRKKPPPAGVSLKIVQRFEGPCDHHPRGNTYEVDERDGTVTCGKCHANLSPIWVMLQLSNEESHWFYNFQTYRDLIKKFEARSRCKSQHCGQMTKIRI